MIKPDKSIYVTEPVLPDFEKFSDLLRDIWESKCLTNNGKYHQLFEKALADYLDVPYISLFANGTLALISALQVLRISGEVITTPYSFVATTHALWWNNIKPVFVDVEPEFYNINHKKIEVAITPRTTAILPVHVYGNPCRMDHIQEIADRYGLKVIYDAAHSFGVKLNKSSVLNFGDLSILSFHATKVFNTIEGGAIVCHDEKTKQKIDYLKNFGFANETQVVAPGINAKMNEIQAAYGCIQLETIDESINSRKLITYLYREKLSGINGLTFLKEKKGVDYNFAYFPVFIKEKEFGMTRDELYFSLQENGYFGRRYFYPLISQFPTYRELNTAKPENLPVAESVGQEVICLPIYPGLETDTVSKISELIRNYSSQQ